MTKALDHVPHNNLLMTAKCRLRSLLASEHMNVGGTLPKPRPVNGEEIRGSLLGPLIFPLH